MKDNNENKKPIIYFLFELIEIHIYKYNFCLIISSFLSCFYGKYCDKVFR